MRFSIRYLAANRNQMSGACLLDTAISSDKSAAICAMSIHSAHHHSVYELTMSNLQTWHPSTQHIIIQCTS